VLMFASWFDHREHQDVVKRRLVDISFIPGD
jgi:hypothetical protein